MSANGFVATTSNAATPSASSAAAWPASSSSGRTSRRGSSRSRATIHPRPASTASTARPPVGQRDAVERRRSRRAARPGPEAGEEREEGAAPRPEAKAAAVAPERRSDAGCAAGGSARRGRRSRRGTAAERRRARARPPSRGRCGCRDRCSSTARAPARRPAGASRSACCAARPTCPRRVTREACGVVAERRCGGRSPAVVIVDRRDAAGDERAPARRG